MEVPRERIPEPVVAICRRLREVGKRGWVVGGCIRDVLLGRPPTDWDVATDALPDDVKRAFRKVIATGEKHGTVTVIQSGVPYEVTTLRGEGAYTDGRRPDEVEFHDDIERDLVRRDFTVNAIAYDPLENRLFDPSGGISDLAAGILRAVGDPRERFQEDGLRILRAARFHATLELALDEATARAIPEALDTFRKVSPERVRDEWIKTMKAQRPSRAFEVMRERGILDVTFPALATMYGCAQNRWHAFDVWGHTMSVLDRTEGDAVLRIAGLLHDVGKPATRAIGEKTQDATFYRHEVVGAEMAEDWLREYRFSNEERARIVHVIRHHLVCYDPSWSDAAVRRWVRRIGMASLEDLFALHRADTLGKGREVSEELGRIDELVRRVSEIRLKGDALSTKDLAVDGRDVMKELGIPPSRRVGEVLEALLEVVTEDPSLNDRDELLARMRALGAPPGGLPS